MRRLLLGLAALSTVSCAALYGWDIHAPGILSQSFYHSIDPAPGRVALYLDPSVPQTISTHRGGKLADPQTYHLGEAYAPMLVEAFQQGFSEFIFLEAQPSADVLKRYGVEYLAVVRIRDFGNRVTLKGQTLVLATETAIFGPDMELLLHYESKGMSDAKKVFAKRGGPEVHLNSVIENNVLALVRHLQDHIRLKDKAPA